MFRCRKVIKLECWNWTQDKVVWWRGPMHKCLSAERSSHLNVEVEPRRFSLLKSHLCVDLHSLIFLCSDIHFISGAMLETSSSLRPFMKSSSCLTFISPNWFPLCIFFIVAIFLRKISIEYQQRKCFDKLIFSSARDIPVLDLRSERSC